LLVGEANHELDPVLWLAAIIGFEHDQGRFAKRQFADKAGILSGDAEFILANALSSAVFDGGVEANALGFRQIDLELNPMPKGDGFLAVCARHID
jgi:hypothetical protein